MKLNRTRWTMIAWVCICATGARAGPALDELRDLAAAGQHAQVLQRIDPLLNARNEWSLSFGQQPVDQAFLGRRYGYFMSKSGPPMLPVVSQQMPANPQGFGWMHHVTCIDLKSGKPLWTRPFLPHPRFGIDPRDDALWVWNEREGWFQQIEPATGKTQRNGGIPTAHVTPGQLECLLDGKTEIWARTTANTRGETAASRYDLATQQMQEEVPRPFVLSPGPLRRLFAGGTQYRSAVTCTAVDGGDQIWTFPVPGNNYNPPIWYGEDAIFLSGGPYFPGVLYRLDGQTGAAKWQSSLNGFSLCPHMRQLRGGDYAAGGWTPIGSFAGDIWAIDLTNRIRFFDADTGKPGRIIELDATPIAAPSFTDGFMTVATTEGMKRLVLDRSGVGVELAEIMALKVNSLLALHKTEEAIAVAEQAVRVTGSAPTFEVLAAVLEAAGRPDGATAARVHAMIAAGATESPSLRRSHGLLWFVPTGPVTAGLVPIGPSVLVAEQDGTLHTIDPEACRELARETVEGGVLGLTLEENRLMAWCVDGRQRLVRVLEPPHPLPADDPLHHDGREEPANGANVDPAWHTIGGGVGLAQRVNGRLVRPTAGGGVRELIDGKAVDRTGRFRTLKNWHFSVISGQAVGFGEGGVYTLDEGLCPERKLITLGEGQRLPAVLLMAGDQTSLAVAVYESAGASLQLWSADGSRKIRSASLPPYNPTSFQPARLQRVGGGYLVSAGELLYLPLDPQQPEWRFSLSWAPQPAHDWEGRQTVGFEVPRIVGNRILVAAHGGGIYVFDLGALARP